ncbi:MAG: carboxypeptidase-like regulatory domain-containing protein [Mariniphaga sp.]|nr:carboxypeptidase-like regulatory domain-containing protein [Mariniphaga sp.]
MAGLKFYILFFVLAVGVSVSAQESWEVDPIPIRVKGRVLNTADKTPVPYAHIINNRTHGGTITNASGNFTMDMLNIDSLDVSVLGFFKESFNVPYNYHPDSIVTFYLRPVSISIRQVDVAGEKPEVNMDGIPGGKPVDIDPELRGDAFNEKPPVLAAFFNPVSFWYYYLNKKEKQKREVRKAILTEKNWEMHSQNYNKEVVISLTGLTEIQAEEFMIWFNAQDVLPYTSTEYEVRASVREYFQIYKTQKEQE